MESAGILEYASVTRVGLVKIAQQVGIFQISMMYNFGSHELQCVSVYTYYVPLYHSVLYMSRQRYIQRRNKVFIYSGLKQRSLEGYRVKRSISNVHLLTCCNIWSYCSGTRTHVSDDRIIHACAHGENTAGYSHR